MLTDPISDMLTRIRNGGRARLSQVSIPESRLKREIARLLHEGGFIDAYRSDEDSKKANLIVSLRYSHQSRPMIEGIERVSRPGRRVYVSVEEIPRVRDGLGVAVLSTPKGILTDAQAREARVGGEVLARVW